MSAEHEIDSLRLEIDGNIRLDQERRLQKRIEEIIEIYFDRYDRGDAQWLIHRIHLDLGTIDGGYLKEEIEVRLAYILDQELIKWAKLSPEEIAQSFTDPIYGEVRLFKTYLEEGINPTDERGLSEIFEALMSRDFEDLKLLHERLRFKSKYRKRLQLQVKADVLKRFWVKLHPEVFKAVQEVEDALRKDLKSSATSEKNSLVRVLGDLRFDFMMTLNQSKASHVSYINTFIDHIDSFKAYEHLIDESFFRYFARLQERFRPSKSKSVKQERALAVERLGTFIETSALPNNQEFAKSSKKEVAFLPHELDGILRMINWNVGEAELSQKLHRIQGVFGTKDFELLLLRLTRQRTGDLTRASKSILKLRELLLMEFRIDLFESKQLTSRLFLTLTKSQKIPKPNLEELFSLLSSKAGFKKKEVQTALRKRIQGELDGFSKILTSSLEELLPDPESKDLKEFDDTEIQRREKKRESDALRAFVYFLASGVWLMPERSSQSALDELLEQKPSILIQKLLIEIETEVIWNRLVYQHNAQSVFDLFQLIFGVKDTSHISKRLPYAKKSRADAIDAQAVSIAWKFFRTHWDRVSKGKEGRRRLLLEAFHQSLLLQAQLKDLSFEEIFERLLGDLKIREHDMQESVLPSARKEAARMMDLLSLTHSSRFESPDQQNIEQLIQFLQEKPNVLKLMLWDQSIPARRWAKLFQEASRKQILQLFQLISTFRRRTVWASQFVAFLAKVEEPKLVESRFLFQALLPYAKEQDEILKSSFRRTWKKDYQKFKETSRSILDGYSELKRTVETTSKHGRANKMALQLPDVFKEVFTRFLESGKLPADGPFRNRYQFESAFVEEIRGSDLNLVFQRASVAHVLTFYGSFTNKNRTKILLTLDQKFSGQGLWRTQTSSAKFSPTEQLNFELLLLTFSSRAYSFDLARFSAFLQDHAPESRFGLASAAGYIDQLQFGSLLRYLNEVPGEDLGSPEEQEELLSQTLSMHSARLFAEIRRSSGPKQFIRKLLFLLDQSRRDLFLSAVFNVPAEELTKLLAESSDSVRDSEMKLVQAIEAQVRSTQDLLLEDLKLLWQSEKSVSYRAFSRFKTLEFVELKKLSSQNLKKIPEQILRFGIRSEEPDKHIFNLLDELFSSGGLPTWSSLVDADEAVLIVKKLAISFPNVLKVKLENQFSSIQKVRGLYGLIGEKGFDELLKKLFPRMRKDMRTAQSQIEQALFEVASKEVLRRFSLPILLSHLHLYPGKIKGSQAEVIQFLTLEFGVSREELLERISKKRSTLALETRNRLSTIDPNSLVEEATAEWDLLIYILQYKKLPWWASSQREYQGRSLKRVRADLVDKLYSEKARAFMQTALATGHFDDIIAEVLLGLDLDAFERLLLALSPNMGGFAISLNLLVYEFSKKELPDFWKIETMKWFAQNPKSGPEAYVRHAFSYFVLRQNLTREDVGQEWLKLIDQFIESGEIRFLPMKQIFSGIIRESITESQDPTGLDSYQVLHDFKSIFKHYLNSGSLPLRTPYNQSLVAFMSALHSQPKEIRVSMLEVLEESLHSESVLKRIARDESPAFLDFVVQLLYPSQIKQLISTKLSIEESLLQLHTKFKPEKEATKEGDKESSEKAKSELSPTAEDNQLTKKGEEIVEAGDEPEASPEKSKAEDALLEHRILVKNAGLVIAWPYLGRYFEMLEMVEDGAFKSESDAVRAVHLLQYVATGEAEAPEHELILNKVLCGLNLAVPVPLEIALSENEIKTTEIMLGGLMQNWDKMSGSSSQALREGFLIRDGFLEEKEKVWELQVEKKTLDILMQNLPWAFGIIKLPWMEKRLNVEWL